MFVEKEVFDCLLDSDQDFDAYEELEDDFVLAVNDNKPALELVEDDADSDEDQADRDFANKGVKILEVREEDDEEMAALNEYRLRMAALLPQTSSVPGPEI